VEIPPLRERPDDIRALVSHFVNLYAEELGTGHQQLADATMEKLEAHDWPGNVRELENAIKRALVLASGDVLTPEDFAFLTRTTEAPQEGASLDELVRNEAQSALESGETGELYRTVLERVERPLLEAVLEHTEGNQIRAAAMLGINRNTLRKKIVDLEIDLPGRGPV
jgi:two-component system nitrogen regulation response regulator GlnG